MICTLKRCIISAFDNVKHGETPFFLQVFRIVVVNYIAQIFVVSASIS